MRTWDKPTLPGNTGSCSVKEGRAQKTDSAPWGPQFKSIGDMQVWDRGKQRLKLIVEMSTQKKVTVNCPYGS